MDLDESRAIRGPQTSKKALGVGLGGNETHIGATANEILCDNITAVRDSRGPYHPGLRRGVSTMLFSVGVTSVPFSASFELFS
jgi:Na+/H+ antiporter NhaD/arsenite permease-like protein